LILIFGFFNYSLLFAKDLNEHLNLNI